VATGLRANGVQDALTELSRAGTLNPDPAAGQAERGGVARSRRPPAAPRRILYVEANEDNTIGGSHLSLFNLVKNLDWQRYRPVVLYYQQNPYVERLRQLGVEVHVWEEIRRREHRMYQSRSLLSKTLLQIAAVLRRRRFLRKQRISLVHLNNAMTTSFDDWLPAAHMSGIPCISHARGQGPLPTRLFFRLLIRRFDRVIVISDFIGELVRYTGIPRDRVRRVYNAIDVEAFREKVRREAAEVRRELGVAADAVLFVMVSHLRGWKGQDTVLAALRRLPREIRDRVHIAFVGGTPEVDREYAARLRDTVTREDLGHQVTFLGERSDVPDLTNAADVVLHAATQPEPFGLVLLEAMALGKPLVAANIGGPLEIVTPESGILFDPRAPAELAGILERLVADPELRRTLSAGARARVEDFSLSRTVAGVQAVYAELFDGVRMPSGTT
jgi:glycosyltransferase involved in cell wall biosynthesis